MRLSKKLLSGVMAAVLTFGSMGTKLLAANIAEISSTEVDSVYNLAVDSNSLTGWEAGPNIYSEAGIVMNVDTGAILYAKNIDDKHYPASITKVATALVALQNFELDETVTFTWDDISILELGDAHAGVVEGEEFTMEEALYAMMLKSANEVAHGIGAHMEGGYDAFLQAMNDTAAALGCLNTHFTNTNGLHDEDHYTSVRDMALLASAAFGYEEFRKIISTQKYTVESTNMSTESKTFWQRHRMVYEDNTYYYEYCVGGKTGYTDQALTTLVTFATKGDTTLVAVVMRTHGQGTNAYVDTRAMLDYGFDNFTKVAVTEEMIGSDHIAELGDNSYVMLPEGVSADALTVTSTDPSEEGDKTGKAVFTYEGMEVGTVSYTITDDYYNNLHGITETKTETSTDKEKGGVPFALKVVLAVIAVFAIAVAGLYIYVYYKRKELEEKRRLRRMQYKEEQYKEEG